MLLYLQMSRDIMHPLLRCHDDEKFSRYNCPHMADKRLRRYADMALSESNPLGSFLSAKGNSIPRGSHPIKYMSVVRTVAANAGDNRNVNSGANTKAQITEALTGTANPTAFGNHTSIYNNRANSVPISSSIWGKFKSCWSLWCK